MNGGGRGLFTAPARSHRQYVEEMRARFGRFYVVPRGWSDEPVARPRRVDPDYYWTRRPQY
jgi:hypothetical protein